MKKSIYLFIAFMTAVTAACNKNYVQTESGTINGQPAVTLYGNSRQPSDYLFINTALKEISYNGQVESYEYGYGDIIYLNNKGYLLAKGTLDTMAPITFTIDTAYGFTFGSTVYTAK